MKSPHGRISHHCGACPVPRWAWTSFQLSPAFSNVTENFAISSFMTSLYLKTNGDHILSTLKESGPGSDGETIARLLKGGDIPRGGRPHVVMSAKQV